jgi:hypothetical protein
VLIRSGFDQSAHAGDRSGRRWLDRQGDFNLWSDINVVVVSDALPAPGPAREQALAGEAARGLELHGYASAEFTHALERGDRLALEAADCGVLLFGALLGR